MNYWLMDDRARLIRSIFAPVSTDLRLNVPAESLEWSIQIYIKVPEEFYVCNSVPASGTHTLA